MISFKNVSKVYKKNNLKALEGIDLEIRKGEIFGFIGQSGAGKSTLIRMINGLENASQGEVMVDGKHISELSNNELLKLRKKIGMIFQSFNLINSRTVYKNVAYPLEIIGMREDQIKENVYEALRVVGIESKINDYPNQLSGGEKQRVAIARSIVNDPKILLCDEATSALDPNTTQSILELLRSVNNTLGITVVLITHEMKVAESICNRIGVLEKGRLIDVVKKEKLSNLSALHPGTRALLAVEECIV
ncbi:MAG TPA: ATP-binding cassette domain-containing protein [Clostridia bacterium]|nr:ATP-binding cassette domain-containing protein [Clostridia bacterium]